MSRPVTAISPSLSTRSTPSIPPASTVYEPLVKSILARRFVYNLLTVSAACAWALAAFWTSWQLGGLEAIGLIGWLANWVSPSTVLYATLWWLFGSVPIAVLRKIYINGTRSTSLSPHQALVNHISQPQYRRALLVVLASSALLTLCHSLMAYVVESNGRGDPKLGIWAGSKKHPYHLNGRLIYIFLAQTSGAMLYWFRDILKDRFDIRWSRRSNISCQALASLTFSVITMVLLSALSTASSLFLFATLRIVALPVLYKTPLLHGLLRPMVAHFLRPKYTLSFLWSHFDVIVRTYFVNLSSQVIWDVTSTMFDVAFSLPAIVAEGSKDPALVLVSGIMSTDSYYQLHAFNELCSLSSESSGSKAKRSSVYADTKHNPTLWAAIVRRSLLLLGTDYQTFLRRGRPPNNTQAAPIIKPSNIVKDPSTPLIRGRIYKFSQASPINQFADTLSSDGALTRALTHTTGDSIGFSDVFGSVTRSLKPLKPDMGSAVGSTTTKTVAPSNTSTSFWKLLASLRGHDIADWWTRERKDKATEKALPNRELDSMIVEVLGTLISHSLLEDQLGHVQRDIPRVLEAMLLFLSAIEEYQLQQSASVSATQTNDQLTAAEFSQLTALTTEVALAGEWLESLTVALRTSIALIVHTFGDRLTSFKFSNKIASRLQSFVDYST